MFLQQSGIEFEEINVAADRAARQEMVNKTGQLAVPVIDIDGEFVVGFDEGWLKDKLGLTS